MTVMRHNRFMVVRERPIGLTHLEPMVPHATEGILQQVVRHLENILGSSKIEPGGRLPGERTVAHDLKVSRNTVTAAYDALEQRGAIRRIRGKGAFLSARSNSSEAFSWSGKVSSKAHLLDEPVLEILARSCSNKLPYPLSAGSPLLECFPSEEYRECLNKVMANRLREAFAVAPTEGQWRLRQSIGLWMNVEPNRIMITSGAQEGVDLVARCLIEPGDYVIIERPSYPGAIQSLRAAGARLVEWPTDWQLGLLEELLLRYHPKLIFTMPTFQNPTGKVMSVETRLGLLDLASRYCVPIVEDDVYSRTYLDNSPAPESLLKLDRRSLVVYISTFSKIIAPGLRVAWLVAPPYMIKQLSLIKMRANLFTCGLNQLALSELMASGGLDRHLDRLRRQHCLLRNAAAESFESACHEELISFKVPTGGLYLWCKLEDSLDLGELLSFVEAQGLSIAPGYAFFPEKTQRKYIRICFTAAAESRVRKGIEILVKALRDSRTSSGILYSTLARETSNPGD